MSTMFTDSLPVLRFITSYGYNDIYFASENDAIKACVLLRQQGVGLTYNKGERMILTINHSHKYNIIEKILQNAGLCGHIPY